NPPLVGVSSYRSQDELMVNTIEEGPDVKIDHPVTSPTSLSAGSHRLQRRAPWSVAVRVGMKQRFHLRLQIQAHDRLSDSVCHRGHSENPDPLAMCLRYFDCPHRRREVTPGRKSIPELVEVPFQVPLKLLDRL